MLVILLVIVYFTATSAAFLKGVILPRVSQSLGAEVTVADAHISPFSRVELRGLKVQPPGGEPLLAAPDIRVNYSLWAIIGGNIAVSEIAVDSPVVTVIQNADGTCNLDAFTQTTAKEAKPSSPTAPGKPLQIDIKKVALNNATVRLVKKYTSGGQDTVEVTGLNFTASDLKNGQSGKIALAATIAVQKAAQTNAAAATLQAKLEGGFDFALTPDLKPASAKGNTTLAISQTTGSLADFNTLAATLDCDLTAAELKELALRLTRANATLAEIRASGPFDAEKIEGKLKLEISGIDKRALNLVGAASGLDLDFGSTMFNSTNAIEISKEGKLISVAGRFNLAKLQVKQQAQISPTLDLQGDYAVTADQTTSSAVLQKLNLNGAQDARALLQVNLSSPMTIGWGNAGNAVGDAALNLVVTDLNLADWKAFAGESAPGGMVNVAMKLVSQKAGQQLGFQLDARLDNLTTGSGSAAVNQGNLHAQASGSVAGLKLITLDNYQAEVVRQGKSLVKISGNGTFDSATQAADLQVTAQTALASLLAIPNANPADGAVALKTRVTHQQKKIALTGEVDLTPTDRAKNVVQLNGNVDVSQSDAITGTFKVAAESLDMTHYFDLLSQLEPAPTENQAVAAAPVNPNQEPPATKLPLKNFTFDLNVGHLFLHEVDIANWQTTALIDGGRIVIKPCQLTLNGAPVKVTTDLNLGVPGYTYDVTFNADAVPLTPLVDSFTPDLKGQIAGTTTIGAQVKGAGITGASLQKNLAGQFNFMATNMDLAIPNLRSPLITSVVNVIVGLPDLIRNPAAALGNLFGGTHKSGWTDALTSSPIDTITMQASVGGGQAQLQSAEIRSAAFQALAAGRIILAPVLTNSTIEIPVKAALSHSLASQIGLAGTDTSASAAYVALPDFLKVEGTIGQPQTKIDKLALVELAAKTTGGIAGKIGSAAGEKAGDALNALGGLLGGKTITNSTSTNANASPVGGLLNLFKKSK
jgi:hypothetical protein